MAVGRGAPAVRIWYAQPVVVDLRHDERLGVVVGTLAERLEGVGIDAKETALVKALAICAAGQVVLGSAEMEALQIGLVGRAVELEACAPILVDGPIAGAEGVAAHQRAGLGVAGRVVVDAAAAPQLAVREALPVLRGGNRAGARCEDRREGGIAIRRDRPELRDRRVEAEIGRIAQSRRQEAALPLDRRIGMREILRVNNANNGELDGVVRLVENM